MAKKKNLSGSYTDDEVTIIGNTPTKEKPRMRDLSINPENEMNIETAVQKLKERQRRAMLVRDKRMEEFSMFRTKKLTLVWIVGGLLLALGMAWFTNLITSIPA